MLFLSSAHLFVLWFLFVFFGLFFLVCFEFSFSTSASSCLEGSYDVLGGM